MITEKLLEEIKILEKQNLRKSLQNEVFRQLEFINSPHFDLEEFFDRILSWVISATETLSAALLLLDDAGKSLEFAMTKGPNSEHLIGKTIAASEGIAGKVISTGKTHISHDVKKDPLWNSTVANSIDYETVNLMAVPIQIKGITKGVIEIINKKDEQPFNLSDISLLQSLTAGVALALENAQLMSQARRQAKDFRTLSRLSAILNSTLDQSIVRKRALESVVELMECETGSLYLIDEEKDELYFEVALGDKGDAVKEVRLKMGEGVAGWVAQEGKSDLVPDTTLDPRWAKRVDEKSQFQTYNMITVPVKAKEKVIGVLQAINKLHGQKPDEADMNLLENLSDQVAIALENARLYEEQKQMFTETAEAMATSIEKRDPYTGGHTKRVRHLSMATAKYLDMPTGDLDWLELSAILHDIGKIGVDDSVLRKPGKLDDEEFDQMRQHPGYGFEILQHVKPLEPVIPGMRYHHERIDGKGYPENLTDKDIPLMARIIAVADTWDAMTSDRPYRKGLAVEIALEELKKCSGTQFDTAVVEAFFKAYDNGEIISQKDMDAAEGADNTSKTEEADSS